MAADSPVISDGDAGFVGFASRLNPLTLPAGMLQLSKNMRLNRGTAKTRKGCKRMATEISIATAPLTVPFKLSDTPGTGDPIVRSSYDGGIFASSVMRSPDDFRGQEIVMLAGPDAVYTVLLDNSSSNSLAWGDGPILDNAGDEIITSTGEPLFIRTLPTQLSYPSSPAEIIEPTDTVSMVQAHDKMFLLREADPTRVGWQPKVLTAGGISVSGTTATVNLSAHGFTAGTRVRLEGSTTPAFDGHEYDIQTAATDTFTITVPAGTASDTTTTGRTVRRVKPPLYWDGSPATNFVRNSAGIPAEGPTYKTLKSVPWASYINGRVIIPETKDSVSISDIYEPNLYDPFWSSFRANQGSNDRLVAVHPWVEGTFLLFMRKSIWLATVSQTPSTNGAAFDIDTTVSKLELLTEEVGCSARRSIQTAGQFVYFLSDSGIYRLDARLDLKLRGDTRPLSDPISDKMAEINSDYAANAVGLWFDNRYYLAAPTNGSDVNNSLFIYSALNEQWETIDNYGWGVDDVLVATYNSRRRVFSSSRNGFLMLLDEVEEGDEAPDASVTTKEPVIGKIVSRRYGFGSMSAKRFTRVMSDVVLPDDAQIEVTADIRNPDKVELLVPGLANTTGTEEDYSLKLPIRRRAHFADIQIVSKTGRPEIRTISIEAVGPSMPPTETRIND